MLTLPIVMLTLPIVVLTLPIVVHNLPYHAVHVNSMLACSTTQYAAYACSSSADISTYSPYVRNLAFHAVQVNSVLAYG